MDIPRTRFPCATLRQTRFVLACVCACAPGLAWSALGAVGNFALPNPNLVDPADDAFGVAAAAGDFNDDGVADLAVADRQHLHLVHVFLGTAWAIGEPTSVPFLMETVAVPAVAGTSAGSPTVLASATSATTPPTTTNSWSACPATASTPKATARCSCSTVRRAAAGA